MNTEERDAVRRELDRELEDWKRAQRIRDAAPDLLEALRPFLPAYQAFVETMRGHIVTGETSAERRFSEGERREAAQESAFEALARVTFDQLAAVSAALFKATDTHRPATDEAGFPADKAGMERFIQDAETGDRS